MTSAGKLRLAIVNSHPIQYFAPLYAYLNSTGQFDVTALYCSDFSLRGGSDPGFKQPITWDIDLLSGYTSVFLGKRSRQRVPAGFVSLIVPEIWGAIRSGGYDAVWLHGHNYLALLIAFVAAKSKGIPILMRGETHLGLGRGRLKKLARRILLGTFYRYCDAFLAIGSANRDFYRALGVPEKKIFLVPYSVDNSRFIAASRLDSSAKASVLRGFSVRADAPVVLYASKFTARKRPDDLVRAASLLRRQGVDFTLLLIGSGEMEGELRKLVAELGLDNVVFGGFVNQLRLPEVYAISDIFVLPSENEPWGLIVNEVMCAGLPVIAADEIGCVRDLVAHEVNGCRYKAGEIPALSAALRSLLEDPRLRARMGQASRERIAKWSFAECAAGVIAAVNQSARSRDQPGSRHQAGLRK